MTTSPIDSASQTPLPTAGKPSVDHDATAAAPARLSAELHHPFRFIAIDWTLIETATGDGDDVAARLDALLAIGVRIALLEGGGLPEVMRRLEDGIRAEHRRRLFVVVRRVARVEHALYGFDRRGAPVALFSSPGQGAGSAVSALFAQVVTPLQIGRHDRLTLAPDRDAEGAAPELADAVQAPAGARRLCEILKLQRELTRELGLFAPPRDAAWTIEQSGFDLAREHEIESLLAIANGYLGSRGSIAEGSSVSRPATFIAGAFEPSADMSRVPELVIAPDWGRLRFVIEDEPFSVEKSELLHSHRNLDMRRGVLLRDCLGRGLGGHLTHIRTLHAASLANRHVLLEAVSVAPLNFTGTIRVDAILSGDVRSASGAAHWESFTTDVGAQSLLLVGRTYGGLVTAMTSHLRAEPELPAGEGAGAARRPVERARCHRVVDAHSIAERCEIGVRVAEARELYRATTLHTSRDVVDPRAAGESLQAALSARSFDSLFGDHERAWTERWRRADIEIDGAPKIERALRFGLYHLLGTANPDDPRSSVGARGLSGEAYRGHVFWDTEIFLVPFYTHCYPEAARAQLQYRHRTLAGAKRKAKALGYEGALYAWESADTGDETTPSLVVTPFGEVMRVLSGEQEHHISADIAYAVQAYGRATGDVAFERGEGLEILVETARFWASRVTLEPDGCAHIRRVIGPDEYHEGVDDNAFTNWMARRNLRAAARAAAGSGGAREDVLARLDLRPGEPQRWLEIADRMALGLDPTTGLIEQFAGYFELAPFSIADYAVRTAPVDMLLGREKTQASQVVKQADVVQLIALLWGEVAPATRRESFLYYEARTAHGSSLSPGTHALVAARLDLHAKAERYFDQTADVDLGNNMGNSAGGVHIAAMGSLWQAVAFGVAGITRVPRQQAERMLSERARAPDGEGGEAIGIEPHLLPGWRHVKIPICWRGVALEIHVENDAVEVAVEGERPLPICLLDAGAPVRTVLAEPGRRYATRRTGDGLDEWEEIARW